MFSSIKMEEYMESELPGIFRVNVVTKNIVLGSLEPHVINRRVKKTQRSMEGVHDNEFQCIHRKTKRNS